MKIDAHAHLVPDTEGLARIERYMEQAGVARTVLVPGGMINPKGMASFLRGTEPLMRAEAPNDAVLELCRAKPEKFWGFVQLSPALHDVEYVRWALDSGAAGLKLNPVVDRLSFDDPELTPLLELGNELELPLYTHILLNKAAGLPALEARVRQFPRLAFIIGHMGFGSSDPEATSLAVRYDNVFLETSVGAFMAIEDAVKRAGSHKLVFGSEAPAHHPAVEWHKIELLGLPASALEQIGGGNILALIRRAKTSLRD